MTSHKGIGRLTLTVPSPMRFKKRPSAFNICVGKQLKGGTGPVNGGRYDKAWQAKFTAAVRSCAKKPAEKAVEVQVKPGLEILA